METDGSRDFPKCGAALTTEAGAARFFSNSEAHVDPHDVDPRPRILPAPSMGKAIDVYRAAVALAARWGCRHIIDIGSGTGKHLEEVPLGIRCTAIDDHETLAMDLSSQVRRMSWDPDLDYLVSFEAFSRQELMNSVIVCTDTLQRFRDPGPLLRLLQVLMESSPCGLIGLPDASLAEDELIHFPGYRHWGVDQLERLLRCTGLKPRFKGWARTGGSGRRSTAVVVVENSHSLEPVVPPQEFRVVAIVTTFNEEDVIAHTIRRLLSNGIEVHLVDNWSTDGTLREAEYFLGKGVIEIERFPPEGPADRYLWSALLRRVEEIAATGDADWWIHQDADEIREPPWAGMTMRDAIFHVDRAGFNAIDHAVLVFPPVTRGELKDENYEEHLRWFRFGSGAGDDIQVKVWKDLGGRVAAFDGGHNMWFAGRRVYPYRFLLKHYPIRSDPHGRRKVMLERRERWDDTERELGWHVQYDGLEETSSFVEDTGELEKFDQGVFECRYVLERLVGYRSTSDWHLPPLDALDAPDLG